jgi:putative ABC transport system permease protein
MEQSPVFNIQLVVRTATDPGILFQPLRDAVRGIDPDQALPEMKTLEQIKTESLGGSRLSSILLGTFAGIALLLATLGLYGVISYSVVQRTREIGIRAAVGATAADIVRLVVRHGMTLVVIGLVGGAAGVFALTRLMSAMLFGVGERDPVTIAAVAGILFVVALIACWLPARRAAKIDPLVALRVE